MAVYYVTHHLYPENAQAFLTDVQQIATAQSGGELLWHIVIYTSGLDSNGDSLGPYYLNEYSSIETLDELITDKIAEIGELIDWSRSWYATGYTEGSDRVPPQIAWQYPTDGQTDVPIESVISIRLREILPSNGMDLNSVYMKVNDITVTPDVSGNKYDCLATFKPNVHYGD